MSYTQVFMIQAVWFVKTLHMLMYSAYCRTQHAT